MSTPESEHEFTGILFQSYTTGEIVYLSTLADKLLDHQQRTPFRRGPGLLGEKSEDWDWEE